MRNDSQPNVHPARTRRERGAPLLALVLTVFGCASAPPDTRLQQGLAPSGVVQWVRFDIKPEHVGEFRVAARVSLKKSRQEPGNLEMRLFIDPGDPSVLFVYSRWKDAEAINYHNKQPHTETLRAVVVRTIRTPPMVRRIKELE